MNIDILGGSPALSMHYAVLGIHHRSHAAVKSDGWTRPLDTAPNRSGTGGVLGRSCPYLAHRRGQGEVPPPGERGLTPLSDPLHLARLKTLGRGEMREREECHKHQQ